MPLRAVLIQPPETGGVRTLLPHFEDGMKAVGHKPPVGILSIATTLKERSCHEVFVIDAIAEGLTLDSLIRRVAALSPDVVGISAWTDFWYPAYRTGEGIKQSLPDTRIVFGGPHVGIFPAETLAVPFVDAVVCGDGEIPFLHYCDMVAAERLEDGVPGLHLKPFGVQPESNTFYVEKELDGLPIIDRRLLPLGRYNSVLGRHARATTMITSRGCPFRCSFCKLNFQKTLSRSAESVIEEFRAIHELGIREVEIYDDTFTWSKKRLIEICQGLIDTGLNKKVEWAVRDRVNSPATKLYPLMRRAGCRRIHLGIESGVQRVIDCMNKRITLEQATAAVAGAKRAGLTVLTYFMFGNAEESLEDMLTTVDFALSLRSDYAEFSITIPYPGTEMYQEALSTGAIAEDFWRRHAHSPVPDVLPQVLESHVNLATMRDIQRRAIRSFYFRPRQLAKEAMSLRNPAVFLRKARMGARLYQSVYRR